MDKDSKKKKKSMFETLVESQNDLFHMFGIGGNKEKDSSIPRVDKGGK